MNFMKTTFVVVFAAAIRPAQAADKAVANPVGNPGAQMSPTPISEGIWVSPGRYTATIAPSLNMEMAGRLKKALEAMAGLEDVEASSTDSTVHFTVKEGVKVRVLDLQAVVAKTHAGAVMTTPVLANSLTPKPGL